jgi:hypothetical protein
MLESPQCNELAYTTFEVLSIREEEECPGKFSVCYSGFLSEHVDVFSNDKHISEVFSFRQYLTLCFIFH